MNIKLEPGYELNLAIAKHVLGVKFPSDERVLTALTRNRLLNRWKKPSPTYWIMVSADEDNMTHVHASKKDGKYDWKFDIQNYSKDVDDAIRMAKWLRREGFSLKIWQPAGKDDSAVVSIVCSKGPCPEHGNTAENHHGAYDVEGPTLPMAICKAALIAKKVIDA